MTKEVVKIHVIVYITYCCVTDTKYLALPGDRKHVTISDGGHNGETKQDAIDRDPFGVAAVTSIVPDFQDFVSVLGEHLLDSLDRIGLIIFRSVQWIRRDVVLDVLDQLCLGSHHIVNIRT